MRDRILIIDDEANLRKILEATLVRAGYEVSAFESFEAAKGQLDTEAFDVVLTDLQMPGLSGMDVLSYCKQFSPDLPVVLITAFGTVERAVAAMQAGAFDFVLKPFRNEELFRILEKAIQSRIRRRREPATEMMSALGVGPVPLPLLGVSPESETFRKEIRRISEGEGSVLMRGEIGTGKRSVALEIHRKSQRARGPFIQINAEAVPPAFQLSELFGVEKGYNPIHLFSKPGGFELAQGGTLLIEEIDALSVEAQNHLFTLYEDESFTRLGGVKQFPMDFRLISTTSRDLSRSVREGDFHVELYEKLAVEVLDFMPLRERKTDLESTFIPYFVERASRRRGIPVVQLSSEARAWLLAQPWDGNLGELERKITQGVNRAGSGPILVSHFTSDGG